LFMFVELFVSVGLVWSFCILLIIGC